MAKDRRLGRGLEALLGRTNSPSTAIEEPEDDSRLGVDIDDHHDADVVHPEPECRDGLLHLSVYEIDSNPYQPRKEFDEDEISALSESIREHGLLQPILVRRDGDRFQLISGERRWRAAIRAGWSEVPATVRDADDRSVAEMTIVENLQRKDLGPLEKAVSFQEYLERYQCTQEELAQRLSIDRSTVSNLIRLLELPAPVQQAIRQGILTAGHARALLPLGDDREQIKFSKKIQAEQLSVRATEQMVSDAIQDADAEPLGVVGSTKSASRATSPRVQHLASLEQELRAALGAKVEIRQSSRGRGKFTIHFTSNEEFDRLRSLLKNESISESRAG